jgi:hypothetical protein
MCVHSKSDMRYPNNARRLVRCPLASFHGKKHHFVSKIADRCACALPQDIPLRLLSYTWRRSSTQFCREALCVSLVSWLRGVRVVSCCLVGTNDSCPLNSANFPYDDCPIRERGLGCFTPLHCTVAIAIAIGISSTDMS